MSLLLNLVLGLFNLFPFPPLDGASVITLFMPEDFARRYLTAIRSGSLALIGMVVAWMIFPRIVEAVIGPLYVALF